MKWIQFLQEHRSRAEAQAKGKVVLKPRHMRRLRKLWEDKYTNGSLSKLFEVMYVEKSLELYKSDTPLVKLIKRGHSFTGQTYHTPVMLGMEK